MNNKLKGAAAAAAAVVLLLGGYGTLAAWNDEASLNGGPINSGQLGLSDPATGVWTDVTDSAHPVAIPAIAAFSVVPGDVLTYQTSATVSASGDNLAATLLADPNSVTSDGTLASEMEVTTAVTSGGQPISSITDADNGKTVAVTVTFNFEKSGATDASQLKSLNLENLKLTLNQA